VSSYPLKKGEEARKLRKDEKKKRRIDEEKRMVF
jgi:hypothetical protein